MSAAPLIPSLMPLFVVAAMRKAEARIIRQLTDAGAFTSESAIALTLRRSFDTRRLQGLVQGGAVCLTTDGRHFLDADGWSTYRHNRRRRGLLALAVVVALVGVVFLVAFLATR